MWLVQALVRPGYDITRHPISLIALSHSGFDQLANSVITGPLVFSLSRAFALLYTDATDGAQSLRSSR